MYVVPVEKDKLPTSVAFGPRVMVGLLYIRRYMPIARIILLTQSRILRDGSRYNAQIACRLQFTTPTSYCTCFQYGRRKITFYLKSIHLFQVLHVIDQVLLPLQPHGPSSISSPVYNPNAYHFLEHSDLFNIGQHRLR